MTRVLVVAASVIARAGLEALVSRSPSLALVGSASGVDEWPHRLETLRPDVLLIELEADEGEQMAALAATLGDSDDSPGGEGEDSGAPAIVVLASDAQGTWAREALRSGVRAVLPRRATAAEIVAAIEAAAAGLVALHPDAMDSLLAGPSTPVSAGEPGQESSPLVRGQSAAAPGEVLTPREIEVLGMLAEGLGNKEIAWRLRISEHTVKFHVASIFGKLNASSRTEAVTLGLRQGLITL